MRNYSRTATSHGTVEYNQNASIRFLGPLVNPIINSPCVSTVRDWFINERKLFYNLLTNHLILGPMLKTFVSVYQRF
jgi:hypothetical protein